MVLVMRDENPRVGEVTCEAGDEGRGEGVTLSEGEMGEEGVGGREEGLRGDGALSVLRFLEGRMVD